MKLSERLGIHAQDCALAAQPDNDMVIEVRQLLDLVEALTEARVVIKLYEDSPVAHMCGECEHTWMRHVDTDTSEQDAALAGMCGSRVRIIKEEE